MRAAVSSSLPHVVDAGAVEALVEQITTAATTLQSAMLDAQERWKRIPEVFDVTGAEGAAIMLDPPTASMQDFVTAMFEGRRVLSDAATYILPSLKARREELAARIVTVNQDHADAHAEAQTAETAYWAAFDADQDSSTTTSARADRMDALHAADAADRAVGDLQSDIERFRRDIDDAEESIAGELKRISGGDEVRGAWGEELRISQTYWGVVESSYPMGPITHLGLAERLEISLSDASAARLEWLSTADSSKVEAWIASHPDFASAVGFVDPDRAIRLWEGLEAQSSRGSDGEGVWQTGPLAQLFALAPFAIGNLNGLRAADKTEFNRETLRQLLAGDLNETQRSQLEELDSLLKSTVENPEPPMSLLSLFLETDDGSPRVSVGFGDVDAANQITTLTHGIATDTGQLGEWSDSAIELKAELDRELGKRDSSTTTATVLFMEWDSGDTGNVWNIERPDAGAERMEQLLRGFEVNNPDAQLNLGLHSLGTTAGTQMIADNRGLVDSAWLYGSAGVTQDTVRELEEQIRDQVLTLHATHADDDIIAPIGRWPVSEHQRDPREIGGVHEFSADGGWVPGYGEGTGEHGERTEGHNSQRSTEWIYRVDGWQSQPSGFGSPRLTPVMDDEAVGYLDPVSQSFKQTVIDLVDAAMAGESTR
ncbi:alpha/beta hydrolase [Microbacterium sp. AGC85]